MRAELDTDHPTSLLPLCYTNSITIKKLHEVNMEHARGSYCSTPSCTDCERCLRYLQIFYVFTGFTSKDY